jgi:hypothetical protein
LFKKKIDAFFFEIEFAGIIYFCIFAVYLIQAKGKSFWLLTNKLFIFFIMNKILENLLYAKTH